MRRLRERTSFPAITQALQENFSYDEAQALACLQHATRELQKVMDDEGVVEATVLEQLNRLLALQDDLLSHALAPLPSKVLDVLGSDPDNPLQGALYRDPSPQEKAQAVQTKVTASKAAIQAAEQILKLISKRSKRWADRPQTVVVGLGGEMTEDDKDFLKRLGLAE